MFNILTDQREGPVTFAEPGTTDPFSTSVKAALGNIVPFAPRAVEAVGEAAGALPTAVTAPLRLARAAIMQPLDPLLHPEPYRDIWRSFDRSMMMVEKSSSESVNIEDAYDRRVAAIKEATGVELESPERYRLSERELRSLNRDGPIDAVAWKRARFEQQLEELRQKHPDQAEALAFGDIGAEVRALAKGAFDEKARAAARTDVEPVAAFMFGMAGGITGQRRDPLFLGSLFLGPTTAVGKQALTRVATAGLFQGLFNAGVSAIEQPTVQDWRARIGVESGVIPALEDVGMAFVMGLIPGAGFRAIHETAPANVLRARLGRIMRGTPEPGDIEAAAKGLGHPLTPEQLAVVRAGEEAFQADRAVLSEPRPKDVSPELHDDLMGAALKHADDPINEPSPAAVAAVNHADLASEVARLRVAGREAFERGDDAAAVQLLEEAEALAQRLVDPADPEVTARIAEARPETIREAQLVATEALEDIGTRDTIAQTRAELDRPVFEPRPAVTAPEAAPPPTGRARGDILDKVPHARDDGSAVTVTPATLAKAGEKESTFAMLVRSCK